MKLNAEEKWCHERGKVYDRLGSCCEAGEAALKSFPVPEKMKLQPLGPNA